MDVRQTQTSAVGTHVSNAIEELRGRLRQSVHDLRNVLASQTSAVHLLSSGIAPSEIAPELAKQTKQFQALIDRLEGLSENTAANNTDGENSTSALKPSVKPDSNHDPASQRVLVVDDNVDAALSLARLLKFEGFEVATAHDGRQALQQAQTSHPDVVVLDIEMPIMDGYEAAHRIRQDCELLNCKLIAVSGHSDAEHRERALAAGFHAHVTKPIDPETLVRLF
jgi:CheY-like chemotaxis protein